MEKKHASVLKHLTGRVLDMGCGEGILLKELSGTSCGIDISEDVVDKCLEKGLDAYILDVTEPLPFGDKEFNWAVMVDVLEHLREPLAALKEAHRVAKHVIVTCPNFNSLTARLQVLAGKRPENWRVDHVQWFNKASLEHLFREAGMEPMTDFHTYRWLPKVLARPSSLFALSFTIRSK